MSENLPPPPGCGPELPSSARTYAKCFHGLSSCFFPFPSSLCSPHFEDEEHFKVLVKMGAQELSNGIPDSGHLYASIRASRTLTPAGELQEMFAGMEQVRWDGGERESRLSLKQLECWTRNEYFKLFSLLSGSHGICCRE